MPKIHKGLPNPKTPDKAALDHVGQLIMNNGQ